MGKIIQTSFKKDEERLYQEVQKHSDKSAFIKDCIAYYLESYSNSNNSKKDEKNNHFGNTAEVVDILQNL